jgi:hypothetical protein
MPCPYGAACWRCVSFRGSELKRRHNDAKLSHYRLRRRVAHPFASVPPFIDKSASAINPLGRFILQLTCLCPALDFPGGPPFAGFAKGGKPLKLLSPFSIFHFQISHASQTASSSASSKKMADSAPTPPGMPPQPNLSISRKSAPYKPLLSMNPPFQRPAPSLKPSN